MAIRFVIDSGSDILPAEAEKKGMVHVPLTVSFEGQEYLDAVELEHEEFYDKLESCENLPVTSQVLFREKDGFLLPYISVRIASELEEVPLKSITVAPKNHIDLAKNGMMLYLQSLGYEVPVRLSGIKLRY